MAGRPKTRARKATDQAPAAAPAADPSEPFPAAVPVAEGQRTRAHAREGYRRPTTARTPGARVGSAVDDAQADAMSALASSLRPGLTLRVIRTRPVWCAGWCEDITIEPDEGLEELFEHVSSSWGGQRFQIQVVSGAQTYYDGRIAIAAQPRHHGRLIDRRKWLGEDELEQAPARVANQPAAPAPQSDLTALSGFLNLFISQQAQAADRQMEAMREMSTRTTETTRELVQSVVAGREEREQRQHPSFAAQLGELVETTAAIEKVKKHFGAADREQPAADDSDLGEVKRFAMKAFAEKIVGGLMHQPSAQPPPQGSPQQPPPSGRPNGAPGPRSAKIPASPPAARPSRREN